jgi:hypothetical protein
MEDEKSVPGYRVSNIERGQAVWRADLAAQDGKRRKKLKRPEGNSIIGRFLDPEPLARQTAHPRKTSMSPMSALRLSQLHDLATSKMVCGYRHAEIRSS